MYLQNWRRLVMYMVFLFLPTLVMSILGILGLYLNSLIPASALASNIIIVVVLVVSLLFSLRATIALTRAIQQILGGQATGGWKSVFNSTSRLLWPFIYTSILVGLLIFGGTLLFIIPGIIFTVWFAFAVYAVILDDTRGVTALKLSKRLVVGRWWTMALLIFAPNIIFVIVSVILRLAIALPLSLLISSELGSDLMRNVISSLSSSIIAPLTIFALALLYQSAKENPVSNPPASLIPPL